MANSFNLDKIFKDMRDDWFLMDSHAENFVTLILYDTENHTIVGRTNHIVSMDYADNDYVKDYQNKFDDLYEEQTGHENSQYQFELVPVGITSVECFKKFMKADNKTRSFKGAKNSLSA